MLRHLGVLHDGEPVLIGIEGHDAVVPDPETAPPAVEVDVLGGETQHPGVGVD